MATLTLSAGDNSHADTNLKITSNLSSEAVVYMDDIGADSGEVDAGSVIPLENTGTAKVVVKDKYGHMVGVVPPKAEVWLFAGYDEVWKMLQASNAFEPAAAISVPAAITGGDAPTEAEHNALRTAVASINTALANAGITL